ncbi:MAG: Toxin RTX-I translocation ATP-binding protein [Eubacteriales bacterium SKADARSKE-1]|nr:Toxin RTX-I translocation ATP-binding protein [Eubacteriales bacterium SKADARSKE-1]
MGWFNEQLKTRIKSDKETFENSFLDLSSVVLGRSFIVRAINNDRQKTKSAIEEILKYYKAKIISVPDEIVDMNKQMEYLLRPTGIMRRIVNLDEKWWKSAIGPMIGQTKSGDTVALLPHHFSGYTFLDYETGKVVKVNNKTSNLLEKEAFCFYRPFPLKSLKVSDLAKYTLSTLEKSDFVVIILITLLVQVIGMILPYVNNLLFSKVVPTGNVGLLLPFTCLLVGMTFSTKLISIGSGLIGSKIGTKMNLSIESASMSRLMLLPATFFKQYSSGEMAARIGGIQRICAMISSLIFGNGLVALCSFVYLFQMNQYAPQLVIPGLIFVFIQLGFTIMSTFVLLKISRKKMLISAKLQGLVIALFSGIQKIKLGGAEKRAFAKWESVYKEKAKLSYDPPMIIKIIPIFSTIIAMIGNLFLYYIAGSTGVTQANYFAFNTAFAAVSGAIMALSSFATSFSEIKPLVELVKPVLDTSPEITENKKIVTKLTGEIEINNISFRYGEGAPLILDDLSLRIQPGQYVAIVGKTGCGKSTLMRLLLGFEKAEKGAIYYDGIDTNKIDLRSMRQHIGAVMQNGKLFQSDIYSNIVISAPWLSLDDAWKAAKLAGIDKDIEDMPMGMNTIITEGGGGISGGQKQRIMIARAIAPEPSILMFDEATSALDNITQKQISESLDSLKNTRIVIAHRLSTIKNCDRVLVIDEGHIIEDGTYDDLIAQGGYFSELVERQQLNV